MPVGRSWLSCPPRVQLCNGQIQIPALLFARLCDLRSIPLSPCASVFPSVKWGQMRVPIWRVVVKIERENSQKSVFFKKGLAGSKHSLALTIDSLSIPVGRASPFSIPYTRPER